MNYELELFDLAELESDASLLNNESVLEIILNLKKNAFKLQTEESLRLYVQNYQAVLVGFRKSKTCAETADYLLYFLEYTFTRYVDNTLLASHLYREKKLFKFSVVIENLRQKIGENISQALFDVMKPLFEFNNQQDISIHDARYLSYFWETWTVDFHADIRALQEQEVINYLIVHNFNTPNIFKYITREIIGELHQEDNPYIQEQVLSSHAKRFNVIPAKIGNPFLPDYPPIKQTVEDWLNKEIKECSKRQKKYDPAQQAIVPKDGYKIETSMSVAQTAYLFRLLNKSGIITNKVQMEVLHVLNEKFRSKRTETISFVSLHNKYYNVEDRTKESVKKLLKELLEHAE